MPPSNLPGRGRRSPQRTTCRSFHAVAGTSERLHGLFAGFEHLRAHDLLDRFGITKLSKSLAITLSGGEKRRLAIARSLCSDPKVLMHIFNLESPGSALTMLDDAERVIQKRMPPSPL